MRNYELLFILDPAMDEAARNQMIETVKGIINADGEAGEADLWGAKKLAYPINKKKDGFYVLIPFKASAELPKELDRRLKISDNCMRHIIVCQDEK
ncbi:30S ribosomal protein S6 [Mogibacterium sp.]|mgnify:FL=1|uniref:30S ribosomal protein S6 n=1 Tax=Mogibacterium sp. TaxID=2049035 RepID=UPI001A6188E7|nr:30S ribosomal protein S6 [Mogibacterium sp.]MBL6468345.1 30S ribosomal protein S6 [Mogibacterium sp.]MBN2934595.1 30S ribosomal protein S6 [Mogibacterium sp.]MEE0416941.1 30S ribosomal protein S6 [Clostridia bacterium]MEE1374015.1 30S ribosomal protein S6 [Clostridia bacterium]